MISRKTMTLAGATAGLAAILLPSAAAATPAPARAGTESGEISIMAGCGTHRDVTVYNNGRAAAKARWDIVCTNDHVRLVGWVDDILSDGKCAYVDANFPTISKQAKNCPATSARTNFDWKYPGNSVNVRLGVR